MGYKAFDAHKPQQPVGCEDLGKESNAVDRFLANLVEL